MKRSRVQFQNPGVLLGDLTEKNQGKFLEQLYSSLEYTSIPEFIRQPVRSYRSSDHTSRLRIQIVKNPNPLYEYCFTWIGAKQSKGYAIVDKKIHHRRKRLLVRRIIYHCCVQKLSFKKMDDPEHISVINICNTFDCLRPSHMISGTKETLLNINQSRGRNQKGSRNGRAKLIEGEVRVIRKLSAPPYRCTRTKLSAIFGVSRWLIQSIAINVPGARRTWGHLR